MKSMKKNLYQTGRTNKRIDLMKKAKKPGRRVSKSGKVYYEHRRNESDVHKWI